MHDAALVRLIVLAIFVAAHLGLGLGRLPPFRVDRIGFGEYCRVGVPLTLVTLLAGWLILSLVPV